MADVSRRKYPVLIPVSRSYPEAKGRLLTCYSPVRRSSTPKGLSARLACVKHAASVRPEPGSNSPLNVYMQPRHDPRAEMRTADKRDASSDRTSRACETIWQIPSGNCAVTGTEPFYDGVLCMCTGF